MNSLLAAIRNFVLAITRNLVSLAGAALTTSSAILFLAVFSLEMVGVEGGPYAGILAFVVLPGVFVLGLALIPTGIWLTRVRERRAASRGEAPSPLPVFDLNDPRIRRSFLVFLALTLTNLVILGVASYKAVEVMDSTAFCGRACHSVMDPEFTTYQRSPHSRVACVSCHIGPGANWFVKSKLSGSWQLVSVTFDLYPRPIPTPVENLRPARETCEQCHWPTKFHGDRLKIITRHADDEANSELKTVLLIRVGGIDGRVSKGIHWHVDPSNRIRYLADRKREDIRDVELTRADGSVVTFTKSGPPLTDPEWRTMDCVDCHNRPTHVYRQPEDEVDAAIRERRIDPSLPYVRREGLRVIRETYASHQEARLKIRERLVAYYEKNYPEGAAKEREKIEAAAAALGDAYCFNVFPKMKIDWGTYPNHIGHQQSTGCFRCHDDEHKTADGRTISQDCSTCHSLLAQDESKPAILEELNP